MAYFKDAQEVYDTIGKLFAELAKDEELAPKFRAANTIVQYDYREPESKITVRMKEGEPGDVDFGVLHGVGYDTRTYCGSRGVSACPG